MATVEKSRARAQSAEFLDPDGFPWLENGERLDRATFHERYKQLPPSHKAELIGGIVYVMPSPLTIRHGRNDFPMTGWLFVYKAATKGTVGQNNATTILDDLSEPQPDCALLIRQEYGGQTRDGVDENDEYSYGAPELIVEVAQSSRSIDLDAKMRDYERAGVLEYLVRDLRGKAIHWFERRDGRFEPIPIDADGLLRSRVFPGLWLDPAALLAGHDDQVIAALQRRLATPEHAAFVAELERRRLEIASKA